MQPNLPAVTILTSHCSHHSFSVTVKHFISFPQHLLTCHLYVLVGKMVLVCVLCWFYMANEKTGSQHCTLSAYCKTAPGMPSVLLFKNSMSVSFHAKLSKCCSCVIDSKLKLEKSIWTSVVWFLSLVVKFTFIVDQTWWQTAESWSWLGGNASPCPGCPRLRL